MASSPPPANGVLHEEKPVKAGVASELDSLDKPNGALTNGHRSPSQNNVEKQSEKIVDAHSELPSTDIAPAQDRNEGAFASNQAVSKDDTSKDMEEKQPEKVASPKQSVEVEKSPKVAASDNKAMSSTLTDKPVEKETEEQEIKKPEAPRPDEDTEMADVAPTSPTKEPSPPLSGIVTRPSADSSDKKDVSETKVETKPAKPVEEDVEMTATQMTASPTLSAVRDDVVMADISSAPSKPTVSQPSSGEEPASSSNAPPITPAEDSNIQASIAVSSQPASSPMDIESTEAPTSPTKLTRAREDDGDDEPLAKRAKVDAIGGEVQVKTSRDTPSADADRKASTAGAPSASGSAQPHSLADPRLDSQPMTSFQNRELRKLLALVKKTRAGMNFKLSVETGWPLLWPEYISKVKNPMDISTMEKKLRMEGGLGPYAHMREFKDDIDLIYENSVTFNGPAHDITAAALSLRDDLLGRLGKTPAAEAPRQEKKESAKHHPTRHVEPRPPPVPSPASQAPRRPSKASAASAVDKPVESPAFAIPPNNNGVPLIRRDSTKAAADDRPKRPVNPPKNKDITYEPKKKRKVAPELKFCDEVLTELKKAKYHEFSQAFMFPVDPVAMQIPHYHKVVKKPMDLTTMTQKLNGGDYSSAKDFEKDFHLIVANCRTFNGEHSPYTASALKLEELFKHEWAKKNDWVAKHTPASTAASPPLKDESDDEDDGDAEIGVAVPTTSALLEGLIVRLKEEQGKLDAETTAAKPNVNALQLGEAMTAMLRKQIVEERLRIASLAEQVKGNKKSAKKKGATSNKKASGGGAAVGGLKKSGVKKAAPKPRKLNAAEKDVVMNGIGDLGGPQLERAIDIIKKDTGQDENDAGELELDIENLSDDALHRLYDIITKVFPSLRVEKERTVHESAQTAEASGGAKGKAATAATKPKKNKPMSKLEQERRIQQLNELRAAAIRQGSGSQEPMDSIESNGAALLSDSALQNDSEDEESSEEE